MPEMETFLQNLDAYPRILTALSRQDLRTVQIIEAQVFFESERAPFTPA